MIDNLEFTALSLSPLEHESETDVLTEETPSGAQVDGVAPPADSQTEPEVRLTLSPNPVRGQTTVHFDLPRPSQVNLSVFDATGRRVRQLLSGPRPAGKHSVAWNGRFDEGLAAPAGVYDVRLAVPGISSTSRLVVLN